MGIKNLKRLLSLLLCLCMVVGLLPGTALAVERIDGTMTAKVYTGQNEYGGFEGATDTFAVDQARLILDLRDFNAALSSSWSVESIAFYPESAGAADWGTVFWYDYEGCTNGTKNDKLYVDGAYNGVFQILNFTPNGNMSLEPGTYKVLAYVGNGQTGEAYQELYYLSSETFTITGAMGPGEPVINTATLPTAYVGELYNQTLQATPGTTGNALTWSVSSGTLPDGLQLDANSGTISGTPTAAGTSTFTVQVTETPVEGEAITATKDFTLKVTQKLEITNAQTSFTLNRGQTVNETLTANLTGVTWKITSGTLPGGLYLQNGAITGTVSSSAASGSYQVTVQASADGQTATEEFTFTIGDLFQFNLPADGIDPDAMGRYVYLRAKEDDRDITLWGGNLTEDTTTLMINSGFAGATVTDVRLITCVSSVNSTESVLAECTGSVTLTDGGNATLTGKGQDVLVKLPEITHSYGENARIQTWFHESGNTYKTYQPGAIVAASTTFTLHASAGCSGADDPLAEYDLTTATFTGDGVNGTTYTPAQNTSGAAITVSYTKYELKTVTVTLTPTTTGTDLDLSYAKLTFSQRFDRWTYTAEAVVGRDNTCQVKLYPGVEGWIAMTNAGKYALSNTTIAAGSISGNSLTLTVYGAEERSMAVLVTGKLADDDADLAAYAAALGGSAYLMAETGGKSWNITCLYLSKLLKGSSRVGLWNNGYSKELSDLVQKGGSLTLSYMGSGPLLENSADINWQKDSLTATVDLPISLRGGVLFDLDYQGKNSILMKGWWHQTDTNGHDVWVVGQSKTAYTGTYASNNTVAQYCPGDPGTWDFLMLPSIASPSGMTWDEALAAYPGMPNQKGVTIQNNTVVNLGDQTLAARDANSVLYLTLPNSTFTGPQQFDTTGDTLVFTGHIELDEGANNKMRILRLNAAGTDSGGRVSTQISSVVINGKEYPYTKIQLVEEDAVTDKLVSIQFQTYYQIEFSEPMELPCDITVYGRPMTANSAAVLDLSVLLTERNSYEPVDRVEVSPPSVSVEMPGTVGDRTFTAYVTIPEGGGVEVYDGVDLVGKASRTGDLKITLSGASDSMITSHDLRFVLFDEDGNEAGAYTQTVLHANGAPTLRSQNLQTSSSGGKYWSTHQRDRIYTFTSSNPPQFRMTCTFDHPENLKDGSVVFAVSFLDGTIRYMEGKADGTKGTYVTDIITTSSPVIGATVLYEIDWDKVNKIILDARPVPSDSPTATGYNFDQTIVLNYADFKEELPTTIPSQDTQWTEEQQQAIAAIQDRIEQIYKDNNGSAGYYTIIGDGSEFFYTGQYMIEHLDPGVLPEGYIGETTFTRPLTQAQFEGELGGGEGWTRLTFTEPGETGGVTSWGGAGEGGTTGLEIYATEFTTDSGVSGTLTITRIGEGDNAGIYETGFATAQGTGTGGGTPTSLPESCTVNPGDATFGSGEWFSFTNFEGPSDMEVFTNFCDDLNAQSGIAGSLLEFAGMEGVGGGWDVFGGVVNIVGAGKSMYDGLSNDASLQELHASTMSLLDSPCAQKLTPTVRNNLQSQLNRFNDMAVEAMQWNTIVTLGGTGTGLAGAAGIMSNPITALTAGIGLFGAGKINRQQIDNVRMEAQLARDNMQFQITKYAISSGDTDCAPKPKSNRNAGSSGSSTYRVCIDPSGIVYEAVLSNPVEGATVTLYTADGEYVPTYAKDGDFEVYVDGSGKPATPNNLNDYQGQGNLTAPKAEDLQPSELTLTTGPDGRYQWMVPAGLWYVTAEKAADGYESGSSNSDVAAVVSKNGINWLPVLPAQLDVNIPLVSYDIPTVTAEYRADGVYLTFSKYMDDETLIADNFSVYTTGSDTVSITVEKLNSEQAPANIKYNSTAPSYTSQVKLAVAEGTTLSGNVTVTIGSGVRSYAGVPFTTKTDGMTLSGTVEAATPVAAPTFSRPAGQVDYGSTVTTTCATDGAVLYYTTDGTAPTTSSPRYYGQPIAIDRDMTIRVLAVKPGYADATASASFTVPSDTNVSGGDDDEPGTNPGGGGGVSGYAISVPSSSSIQGGTITVSPKQAAKGDTVTITVKPDDGYELDKLTVTDAKGNELALTDAGGGKYTFTMPGANVKIEVSFRKAVPIWESCTGGAECPAHLFTDVNTSAWYHEAVDYVLVNGLMSGYGNGLFGPEDNLSRAQLCQIIYNLEGQPAATGGSTFTDVADGAWYADAVTWAAENGIVGGYGGGLFGPEDNITREQLAAILYRYAQVKGYDVSVGEDTNILSYADALDVSEWAIPAMQWACGSGVIEGVTEATLVPGGTATRAQVATMLIRFCEYYADTK